MTMEEIMSFDIPHKNDCLIKVVGVGGGGSNAVNYMYNKGITDVSFVVCNTDAQALENSPVPNKVQLGESLTEGRGAGSKPEVGRQSAIENINDVMKVLGTKTKMVFITAGMGGGTGTGAAPIIAKAAREAGLLTVGIVTIPFRFEGKVRINQALEGINEMEKSVDALLVINNERLREMYGDLKLSNAFAKADNVLTTAAKGIAEIITLHGGINVDFADVQTVMKDSGVAIMGSASASGDHRAIDAIQAALESPLLNNNDIRGARNILLSITSGIDEVTMDEVSIITDYLQEQVGDNASIIWGTGFDERLEDRVGVTIIATGFDSADIAELQPLKNKVVHRFGLDDDGNVVSGPMNNGPSRESRSPQNNYSDEPQRRVVDYNEMEREKSSRFDKFYNSPQQPKNSGYNAPQQSYQTNSRPMPYNDNNAARNQVNREEMDYERFIEQLENVPAYKRKEMMANSPRQGANDRSVSRFTLSDDKTGGTRLSGNNPYLHDNVD